MLSFTLLLVKLKLSISFPDVIHFKLVEDSIGIFPTNKAFPALCILLHSTRFTKHMFTLSLNRHHRFFLTNPTQVTPLLISNLPVFLRFFSLMLHSNAHFRNLSGHFIICPIMNKYAIISEAAVSSLFEVLADARCVINSRTSLLIFLLSLLLLLGSRGLGKLLFVFRFVFVF